MIQLMSLSLFLFFLLKCSLTWFSSSMGSTSLPQSLPVCRRDTEGLKKPSATPALFCSIVEVTVQTVAIHNRSPSNTDGVLNTSQTGWQKGLLGFGLFFFKLVGKRSADVLTGWLSSYLPLPSEWFQWTFINMVIGTLYMYIYTYININILSWFNLYI